MTSTVLAACLLLLPADPAGMWTTHPRGDYVVEIAPVRGGWVMRWSDGKSAIETYSCQRTTDGFVEWQRGQPVPWEWKEGNLRSYSFAARRHIYLVRLPTRKVAP